MCPRLQELINKYENGKEYAFRTSINVSVKDETDIAVPTYDRREDVEVIFVVSRDSQPLNEQFGKFYRGIGPVKIPDIPMEMLFIELYKNGYDITKIVELCGETNDTVNEFFSRGVQSLNGPTDVLGRLALATIASPKDKWVQGMNEITVAKDEIHRIFCPVHMEQLILDPTPKDTKIGRCNRYYCPISGCDHELLGQA